jgi:hypothetical protein
VVTTRPWPALRGKLGDAPRERLDLHGLRTARICHRDRAGRQSVGLAAAVTAATDGPTRLRRIEMVESPGQEIVEAVVVAGVGPGDELGLTAGTVGGGH